MRLTDGQTGGQRVFSSLDRICIPIKLGQKTWPVCQQSFKPIKIFDSVLAMLTLID